MADSCCVLDADVVKGHSQKVKITMQGARTETETALNVCIQHVLDRTGIKPNQVILSLMEATV